MQATLSDSRPAQLASSPALSPPVPIALLIPAYCPSPVLVDLIGTLSRDPWNALVVVDDGSGPEYADVFRKVAGFPNVQVLHHAANRGKGAALKTGMEFVLRMQPESAGIVTLDADGQHDPEDVRRVAERFEESPHSVILGTRCFGSDTPLRSRFGNEVTRRAMQAIGGQKISDTQTGLRAIPRTLCAPLLQLAAQGYEFELEMLMAVKHLGLEVVEQPIRTIYEDRNRSSHFHPLRDSMRIYFVLLRFGLIGALSAVLDNLLFFLIFSTGAGLLAAQLGARTLAVIFNYTAVRKTVFLSEERHRIVLPRYLILAAANACVSYTSIRVLTGVFGVPVFSAKLTVEAFLFVANFLIQRDIVFTRRVSRP